ncbi:MAG TPA: putative F420-0 ABC transporter substrate-binding protein [Pseudolysinimonas sp.]|jgi:iron complex transport system substrate-binding protein
MSGPPGCIARARRFVLSGSAVVSRTLLASPVPLRPGDLMLRPPIAPFAAVLAGTLLLAGCSAASAQPAASSRSAAADRPVVIQNCDTRVTFATAPTRVVSIKSTSTEILLALGLGDRIVGTAFQDGPVPAKWKTQAAKLHTITDFMPSEEAELALEPDMVYSGWESAFSADQAGTRSELAALGIGTYVQPAACRTTGAPARLSFADIFGELKQVGSIFRVDTAADKLVAQQKAELATVTKSTKGLSALWYSSGTDVPYVGAGTGAPELVMETVGLTNIAADVKQTWTSLGWESIVADDPDVIILIDASWNTAASKIQSLESNPATENLSAVKNHRFVTLPFPASEAGVRTVDAAVSVSKQLKALGLG